jgi:hypothetical protein
MVRQLHAGHGTHKKNLRLANLSGHWWQKMAEKQVECKRRKVARLTLKASAATGQLHTMFRSIASRAEGRATKQLKDS